MKKVLFSVLAMGALVSCSSEDVLDNAGNDKVEIKLNAGVVTTKAPIVSETNGTPATAVTGVQFLRSDGATASWSALTAASFTGTIGTDKIITIDGQNQYYPTDGSNANILGFYPAATGITGGKASFTIDGSQDVIYAGAVSGNKNSAPVNLAFTHKLTQFKFVVKRDNSVSADVENVSVTIKEANSKFELDLADGTLSAWGTSTSAINPVTGATATTDGSTASQGIMLEPEMPKITLSVSGTGFTTQDVEIPGTDGNKFEAGKAYTLTLTFKAKAIGGEATISNWEEGTAGGADIN